MYSGISFFLIFLDIGCDPFRITPGFVYCFLKVLLWEREQFPLEFFNPIDLYLLGCFCYDLGKGGN